MSKDIVPELLDKLKKAFDAKVSKSAKVKRLLEKLENKKATYLDADAFAVELGELLRDTFAEVIKPEDLPNERMYYNIADRMIRDRLGANYKSISLYDEATQNLLNQQAGIHLKAVVPEMDESRVHGFVEALSEDKPFEEVKRVLKEPIVTFCRSIVHDSIEENVKFHYKSGFRPMIKRQVSGNCCPWCKEVAGTHYYPDVPDGVFRSHNHCRCTIDYRPRKGKRDKLTVQQGKKWTKAEEENKIEKRIDLNLGDGPRDKTKALTKAILDDFKAEGINEDQIYELAKMGTRHGGIYRDGALKNKAKLEKSIRSHYRQAVEHSNKISHPEQFDSDWESKSDLQKQGLLRKWSKDMKRNAEQAIIEIKIWEERFDE
ncbi:hypothetical protein [uncultured Levyella sp.]|uniref:hypothetical protein n=1 Tax=uncultured Levyella sp. TaxID=1715800 RepID=UPI00258DA409|nr:hypothetical protein [uncultured Levyella sp.]